jgi:hypothetical protein
MLRLIAFAAVQQAKDARRLGLARIEVTFSIGDDSGSSSFVAPADGSALTAR